MRIPKHWRFAERAATGSDGIERQLKIWGWSFDGIEDASRAAAERLERVVGRLVRGEPLGQYEYLDVPLREEVLDVFRASGEESAVITRNRYGAKVLNTADVLFADIDFLPPKPAGFFDAIGLLFSARKRQERAEESRQATLRRVGEWAVRNPGRTFRLYRTHAGVRLLFTDRRYDPNSDETAALLGELGSDPLYIRLTRKQECFRARLSPKPWRCGCARPPHSFPREGNSAEADHARWLGEYESRISGFSVCSLLDAPAPPEHDERIEQVIALHDAETGVGTNLPLA